MSRTVCNYSKTSKTNERSGGHPLWKKLRYIKLKAEESLINARKEVKGQCSFRDSKTKTCNSESSQKKHSANNMVHNDVNIANCNLQKQISDLKEIVCTHVHKNKKEDCYNSLFSDSTNDSHNNTAIVGALCCITQQHVRSLGTHSR